MARKSVDEMIHQFSPEEWRARIEKCMEELGLYFSGKKQDGYVSLFPEPDSLESYDIPISLISHRSFHDDYVSFDQSDVSKSISLTSDDNYIINTDISILSAA